MNLGGIGPMADGFGRARLPVCWCGLRGGSFVLNVSLAATERTHFTQLAVLGSDAL